MINVIVILMECITAWLCLHIAFGERIKKCKEELFFFIFYVLLFVLCSYGILSKLFYILFWIFAIVWCKKMFGRKSIGTIVRTVLGILSVGVIEAIVMFGCAAVAYDIKVSVEMDCLFASSFSLIITVIIYMLYNYKTNMRLYGSYDRNLLVFVIIFALFLLYAKLEFELRRTVPVIYVFFFTVLSVFFIYLCRKQKAIFELEKDRINYELQSLYGNTYDELLKEVRRRQHDYKNQLTAVCGMCSTAHSLEELKSMQDGYLGILQDESEFDSILTKCNNPILAGYLYNICLKYKEQGIKIDIDVMVESSGIDIKTKDVIEILGVLLKNACEYYDSHEMLDNYITLTIKENANRKYIDVANVSEPFPYEVLGKMFEKGYSTKGINRGIGLYSVKSIVKKYDGEIYVDNFKKEQVNWIVFKVVI